MTPTGSSETDRKNQALKIISNPIHYQVCEGCGSIVTARTISCPNCHAYRFDKDPERVIAQARALSERGPRGVSAEDLV